MLKTIVFFSLSVLVLSVLIGIGIRLYLHFDRLKNSRESARRFPSENKGVKVSLNNQKNVSYSLVDISVSGLGFYVYDFPDDFQMTQKLTVLLHSDVDKSFHQIISTEVVYIKKTEEGPYRIGLKFDFVLSDDILNRILNEQPLNFQEHSSEDFQKAA